MTYYGDWLLLNKIRDTYGLSQFQAGGDYRIPAAKAPQQYGYNLIQLNPTTSGGHVNYAEGAQVDSFPYQLNIRGATPAAGNT